LDLQRVNVKSSSIRQTVKHDRARHTYFTVGIAFTPGPTRAPASMASLRGRQSSVAPSRMV
jgi:hypothetical protein